MNAVVVAGHAHGQRFLRRKGLQRAQVGGRFHQHAAVLVEKHLADQIERLVASRW
jgi:hypothetical protein